MCVWGGGWGVAYIQGGHSNAFPNRFDSNIHLPIFCTAWDYLQTRNANHCVLIYSKLAYGFPEILMCTVVHGLITRGNHQELQPCRWMCWTDADKCTSWFSQPHAYHMYGFHNQELCVNQYRYNTCAQYADQENYVACFLLFCIQLNSIICLGLLSYNHILHGCRLCCSWIIIQICWNSQFTDRISQC